MWRDASKRALAASALKATAEDVKALGCIDDIVPEPEGGAHDDAPAAATLLAEKLRWHLNELQALPGEQMLKLRYDKFRNMAQFYTTAG